MLAAATASSSSSTRPLPGTSGTPASRASSRALALSPMAAMASADGPTNVSPAAVTAPANPAFSLRKP